MFKFKFLYQHESQTTEGKNIVKETKGFNPESEGK